MTRLSYSLFQLPVLTSRKPQDERRREVEQLGERERGGGHEPKEHREEGQMRVDRSQQDLDEKGQDDIGDGFGEIAEEAQTKEQVRGGSGGALSRSHRPAR